MLKRQLKCPDDVADSLCLISRHLNEIPCDSRQSDHRGSMLRWIR